MLSLVRACGTTVARRKQTPQPKNNPTIRGALRNHNKRYPENPQVTYYDDIGAAYEWAVKLPVAAVSLDFLGVPGSALGNETAALIEKHGFPADKRLGAGVVDGRSVFSDGDAPTALVSALLAKVRGGDDDVDTPLGFLQGCRYSMSGEVRRGAHCVVMTWTGCHGSVPV